MVVVVGWGFGLLVWFVWVRLFFVFFFLGLRIVLLSPARRCSFSLALSHLPTWTWRARTYEQKKHAIVPLVCAKNIKHTEGYSGWSQELQIILKQETASKFLTIIKFLLFWSPAARNRRHCSRHARKGERETCNELQQITKRTKNTKPKQKPDQPALCTGSWSNAENSEEQLQNVVRFKQTVFFFASTVTSKHKIKYIGSLIACSHSPHQREFKHMATVVACRHLKAITMHMWVVLVIKRRRS